MKPNNKLTVSALIVLLSFSTVISLSMPANAADTWTDITTFPYQITTSGNYRIVGSCHVAGLLVNITVPNVVLDGQNCLLSQTGDSEDRSILINENCTNVLVKNINQTGAQLGLASAAGNFTVQDCTFVNNTGGGIFAFNVTGFTIQRCILNNNSDGFVGDYTSNFTLKDCTLNNNTQYGADAYNWTNVSIDNCAFNNNNDTGLNGLGITNLNIKNSVFNNNTDTGLDNRFGNFTLSNCTLNFNNDGLYAGYCDGSTVSNTNMSYNLEAGAIFGLCNSTLQDSNVYSNGEIGLVFEACNNTRITRCNIQNSNQNSWGALEFFTCNITTITDSNISNNEVGILSLGDEIGVCDLTIENSRFINNTFYAAGIEYMRNCTFTNNYFANNGDSIDEDFVIGALLIIDVNSTVSGNTFFNNSRGFMWATFDEANTTQVYRNNTFQNNTYTMTILNGQNSLTQEFYFYNNLVNDTNYVSPESFTGLGDIESQHAPPSSAFHLNCTMQPGTRVYSNGGMIGGNYWAHPNGTGPSQTGTDANKDGFIDIPFELFGNATFGTANDSLPYSSTYQATLTFTAGKNQTLAANQVSSVITVQLSDLFGNTAYTTTLPLSSNSSTGKFYSNSAATMQITSLTIPAGSNTASFYYKDTTACTSVITAVSSVAPSAVTNFTITAHSDTVDHIAISPTNKTVTAGETVNYTTTAYDVYGNSWVASASYLLDGNSISSNVFALSYPDTYVVTAVYNDKTDATFLTVTTGGLSRFVVVTPSSVTVDRSFAIQVAAVDAAGNIVTGFDDTVSLSAAGTTINPTTSGSFTGGIWTGNVTLADVGSFKIFADGGSGHNGTSTTINVNAPSTNPTSTPRPATPTPAPSTSPISQTSIDLLWIVVVAVIVFAGVIAVVVFILKRR